MAVIKPVPCGHCGAVFHASYKQAWRARKKKTAVYCSATCRFAALSNRLSQPIPNRGPCPTCQKTFFSRKPKIFCSMACYVASERFAANWKAGLVAAQSDEARASMAAALRTGATVACLECGADVYSKQSKKRKFCSSSCYRSYLAKRFDRWVANPEGLALPQCYDEFLDNDELRCIVAGCEWRGLHLTLHVNQAHGIPADEFKRAAGFNLGTGVVARQLAEAYQGRPLQGVAMEARNQRVSYLANALCAQRDGYKSLEAREHGEKARALMRNQIGPVRACVGCGNAFTQRYATGRALYCTTKCRDRAYAAKRRKVLRDVL